MLISRMDLSPGSRLENRNRRIWLPRVSRQKAKTRRATENAVGRREVRREWRERERSGGWRYIERPRRDRLKSVGVAVDVSTLPDSTTEPGPATPSCPPTSISSAVESPSPEFKRSKRGRVSIVIGRAAASTELRSGPRSARHRTRHGRGTRGRPSGRSASDNREALSSSGTDGKVSDKHFPRTFAVQIVGRATEGKGFPRDLVG